MPNLTDQNMETLHRIIIKEAHDLGQKLFRLEQVQLNEKLFTRLIDLADNVDRNLGLEVRNIRKVYDDIWSN